MASSPQNGGVEESSVAQKCILVIAGLVPAIPARKAVPF
jgi:hypothetical protein